MESISERFWSKVVKTESCWNWIASLDGKGYGTFSIKKKGNRAHRIAYELLVGAIPEGLSLDHLCRNVRCVNPEHLEPVTHRENILRGTNLMAQNAKKTHCIHGHEFTKANTFLRPWGNGIKRACLACQRNYYWLHKSI